MSGLYLVCHADSLFGPSKLAVRIPNISGEHLRHCTHLPCHTSTEGHIRIGCETGDGMGFWFGECMIWEKDFPRAARTDHIQAGFFERRVVPAYLRASFATHFEVGEIPVNVFEGQRMGLSATFLTARMLENPITRYFPARERGGGLASPRQEKTTSMRFLRTEMLLVAVEPNHLWHFVAQTAPFVVPGIEKTEVPEELRMPDDDEIALATNDQSILIRRFLEQISAEHITN